MIAGGGERRYVKDEAAMLRHQREVDAARTAQAILRRRHAANVALARMKRASPFLDGLAEPEAKR